MTSIVRPKILADAWISSKMDAAKSAFKNIQFNNTKDKTDPPTVIVADDDPDILFLAGQSLRQRGFSVVEANDGLELLNYFALTLFQLERSASGFDMEFALPDVLVTDINMPFFDGFDVTKGLKREGWILPVIIITGLDDVKTLKRVQQMDAAAFFHKPFDMQALCVAVESAIKKFS